MAFGNLYAEPWYEVKLIETVSAIASSGIKAISLADTVGAATPELVRKIMTAVLRIGLPCEIGIHMHSTRASAAAKIQAAYDAGCRRFDSAIGGLGGCPFAQDDLIGNIPTEEVLHALEEGGVTLPIGERLLNVMAMSTVISDEFSTGNGVC